MAEFSPGTLVDGRYLISRRLGSGGMADVYCAEDQQLGRQVALKLLHRRFAQDPGFVERFRREAQAAAGLQHPNIVSVYDRGAFDDTWYIAMEYLPGRSLKQLIRQEAPLAPVRAIDLTIQILQAARFAHRHGVIHRDLKPHNVIVDENDHAKVTDFGIARAGASDMTETGSIMGTAQYLSPEQAQGHAVSPASDLYSVAVVLYEMLTGRVPFDADSAVTIALKHVSEAPTSPTRVNAGIPPELDRVVMWALNKDPADRPQTADELIAALEHARTAIEAGDRGQRTAAMAALAGVGAYKAAAATAVAPEPTALTHRTDVIVGDTNGVPPVIEEMAPHDYERRPPRWPWVLLVVLALLIGGGVAAYLLTRPAKVTVPGVVGQPLNTASTILQNAGFAVSSITVGSDRKAGTVIRQAPQGGIKADEGSTVTVTVSSGPGSVTVPPVESLPLKQAEQMIRGAHLNPSPIIKQNSSSVPSGQVISTQPSAGQSLPPGTSVEVIVSSGPAKQGVPDVTNQSVDSATAQIQAAGFKVKIVKQTTTSVSDGTVLSQDPAANTPELPGTTVTLTVATAPTTVSVPDVKGDQATAASNTLGQAGFNVQVQSKNVTDKAKNGIVLSESPSAGTQAKKGSTVTIVVGQYQPPTTTGTGTTSTPTGTTSTPNGG
ncbi:MAG TPA: Stk1 family PASTA domain-containing Ser/Thr kinase [Solirubrobacteraceae bacterium]|nr:Stk1 family PASTA domain-containing Ser/Thr kinase [Solirubrobacteraceae bacterium]